MKTHLRSLSLGFASALAMLAAGCNLIPPPQPDATHYYVLSGPALTDTSGPRPGGKLRLGLRTVELSPYLRKSTIVVRRGTNELIYNDDARWAEPLEAGLARALRAQLSSVPAVARIYAPPFPVDQERDYDISVNVIRCEGALDSAGAASVKFSAVLEITSVKSPGLIVARKVFTAPDTAWDGKDYGALAASLSEAVAALSHEVTAVLPGGE